MVDLRIVFITLENLIKIYGLRNDRYDSIKPRVSYRHQTISLIRVPIDLMFTQTSNIDRIGTLIEIRFRSKRQMQFVRIGNGTNSPNTITA